MINSIKLKHGKELQEIMKDPILLSIIVQIAFNMNDETGEAIVNLPKEWFDKAGVLVVMGIIEHRNFGTFKLLNKKVIDITLKKKPKTAEINKQPLIGAKIIPQELLEYHKIAVAFWDLFFINITNLGGRLVNLENAKFEKWVTPIRLMIETDKVTRKQLREVFKFLQKSNFWKDKVQSTAKLRVKFNTLHNQFISDEQRDSKARAGNKSGVSKVSTSYVRRVFNDLQS